MVKKLKISSNSNGNISNNIYIRWFIQISFATKDEFKTFYTNPKGKDVF